MPLRFQYLCVCIDLQALSPRSRAVQRTSARAETRCPASLAIGRIGLPVTSATGSGNGSATSSSTPKMAEPTAIPLRAKRSTNALDPARLGSALGARGEIGAPAMDADEVPVESGPVNSALQRTWQCDSLP